MISFLLSIVALVLGYFIYGRITERVFVPDPKRQTPAINNSDGVDYVPMPAWKVYMVQFLNIAGTGPIFGAIMGAKFGPSSYLWIVFGCIFAGAVHDYFTGMLSVRNNGAVLPELAGKYMGAGARKVILAFTVVVLLLVGAVFVFSPALILGDIFGGGTKAAIMIWVVVIFMYYILATLLPVDKIIGKFYPIFAGCLLFMAIALMVCLIIKWPVLPEVWHGLGNLGEQNGLLKDQPILPCLFITIACGAVSGFHASQSPLMARCVTNEKAGRPIFYGAMITEGIVALIWAAVSSWFFFGGGAEELGSTLGTAAPEVVVAVSRNWLGIVGGILAIIGVVVAPITSGDTAFRSIRVIIADAIKLPQGKIANRLMVSIPVFCAGSLLLWFNIGNEDGFNIIWRYFGWANQTLATIMLYIASIYLVKENKGLKCLLTTIPALFMTGVTVSYICIANIGLNLPTEWGGYIALATFVISALIFFCWRKRYLDKQ